MCMIRRGLLRALVLAVLGVLLVPLAATAASPTPAQDPARAVIDTMLAAQPDPTGLPWRYARGVFMDALHRVATRTGERRYATYLRRWGEARVRPNGVVIDSDGTAVDFWAWDNLMPGRVLAVLGRETGDPRYRKALEIMRASIAGWGRTRAGAYWHNRRATGQVWADGGYMLSSFLLGYASLVPGGGAARDEAANQLVRYAQVLQDTSTGLLKHAYSDTRQSPWADRITGRSGFSWCRANGWFGVALTDVIAALPPGHPRSTELRSRLAKLAWGLKNTQDPATGRWFQLIDLPRLKGNWLESSCSFMHATTLGRAVQRGWINTKIFAPVVAKAKLGALAALSFDSAGRAHVEGTSVGTSVGDAAYYLARPRVRDDLHGVGAFVLMHETLR